jgi:hypothetical protein
VEASARVRNGGARPRMAAEMQGILVAFSFVFVFETIVAVLAGVLFLHLVRPRERGIRKL